MSIEQIVRPWVDVTSKPQVREPKAPALVQPEAFIEWGGAAEFAFDTFRTDASHVGFNTKSGDEDPTRTRHVFSEEGRTFRDTVVRGVLDADQYIIVRDALRMGFNGPDGAQFRFSLNPQVPGTHTGSGQTPPAPPSLDQM